MGFVVQLARTGGDTSGETVTSVKPKIPTGSIPQPPTMRLGIPKPTIQPIQDHLTRTPAGIMSPTIIGGSATQTPNANVAGGVQYIPPSSQGDITKDIALADGVKRENWFDRNKKWLLIALLAVVAVKLVQR